VIEMVCPKCKKELHERFAELKKSIEESEEELMKENPKQR